MAVTITFQDVVCRSQIDTNAKYRLVLFASEDRKGELRSDYRRGADVFGWKPPFKQPVELDDSTAPVHLVIELREKGWVGRPGRNVCSYSLDVIRDCQSITSNLQIIRSDIPSPPGISVTISVTGLAPNFANTQTLDESNTPDAARPALAVPPAIGRSNIPDRSPLEDTTSVPEPPSLPTVHISSGDDPNSEPHIPSSDLSGLSMPGGPSTDQESAAAHSPRNKTTGDANTNLLSVAQTAFDEASRDQSSIHSRPSSVLDLSTDAVPAGADAFGQAMWSGVSRLDAVVRIVAIAADIHPLVKGAWSLLNVAYTLAKDERELDLKIENLVHALDTNCEFARVLAENQLEGAAASIVANILREVLKGASLIKEYCTTRRSTLSVIRFAGSTTSARVDACLKTLDVFRRDLGDHIAAGVHRDLQGLQRVAVALDGDLKAIKATIDRIEDYVQNQEDEVLLNQMPYASEADRALVGDGRACLPETRREIIEAIVNWAIGAQLEGSKAYVQGLHPSSRVLWLCGVAGSGKSSIAISVARALRSMDRLGALYGFETAFQATLNPTNLLSTIARQHAERRPARKQRLVRILKEMDRPERATSSASEQLRNFLASTASEEASDLADVIVIDAFDESGSVSQRATALFALSPKAHNPTFPHNLRFIITSRYDPDIARRLEDVIGGEQPMVSVLQMEHIHPSHTERDIRTYVTYMLRDTEGLDTARAAGDIVRLALTAEHSFQWASVACRYIADRDDHDASRLPADRLKETLATRGGLDTLYLSILDHHFVSGINNPTPPTLSLRYILGSLVYALEPLSVQVISELACADASCETVDSVSFHMLARKLAAILIGTKDKTTPLVAFHASFTDFLADAQRGKSYAVDAPDMHLHLALASLTVMSKSLRFNICDLETSFLRNNQVPDLAQRVKEHISPELFYACRFWPVHAAFAFSSASVDSGHLRESFSAFLENKLLLLEWLEVMSLTGTDAYESLSPMSPLQTEYRALSDLITFIAYFTVPISTSVPHIYLSALAFTPSSSSVTSALADFPNLVQSSVPLVSWPQIRHTFAHQSEVHCVAFSPNGKWVLSGAESGEISVWDVYSGRLILPRMFGSSRVFSMAISADGSLLASGFRDGNIQLWDLRTMSASGEPLRGHTDEVDSVAFSQDGALLASGSDDKTVRLWAVSSRSQVGSPLLGHSGNVLSVAFSPSGDILASGGGGTIQLWNVQTVSATGTPLGGRKLIWPVVFSPNGTLLASGEGDGTVHLWDANTMSALEPPLTAHTSSVRSLSFSPDSKLLASCSDDRTIDLWDMTTRSQAGGPLVGHTGDVVSIAFSPDGALLASGSSDNTVRIWDARVPASSRESPATQFKIQDFAAFSPDGKLLASGSDNNAIQLWDVHSVSAVGEPLKGHTNGINCVAFSPDGALLASGSDDETVRLWDVRTGSAVGEPLRGHSDAVWALAFLPDGQLLASGSNDGTVRLWDTHARSASRDPLTGHSGYATSVAFSPDGSNLASGDYGGTVRIWDVQTRSLIGQALEGHSDYIRCVAFSPDGALLASGSDDGTVRIWEVTTHSAVGKPLTGDTSYVTSLAFSPDGMLLASGLWDEGVVRVWDVRAPSKVGEPVALLRHKSTVQSIAFSPNSPLLSSITSGGVVRNWELGYLLSATSSTLPQNPEERLKEHTSSMFPDHPDLTALSPHFLVDLDDGWALGPKDKLVMWIPPALRPSIDDVRVNARFGGPPHVKLDFSNFACDSDWIKCYSPPSVSTSNS